MKECPQCKTVYSDEMLNFCLSDGAALVESGAKEPETIPYAGATTFSMNAPPTGQQEFGSTMGQGPNAPAKRGCMGPILIGVIALVVLGMIAAAGVFAFMKFGMSRGTDDDKPTPTRTPTSTSSPSKWDSPGASPSPSGSPKSTTSKKDGPLTKDAFNQIKTGMTYQEVVDIIGFEGEEISMSEAAGYKIGSYKWQGEGYSMIFGVFTNDKLQSKSQANLK